MLNGAKSAEANNFIEDALGDFAFGQLWQGEVAAIAREERDDVGVVVEAGAFGSYVVGYDQVGVFGAEFFAGVFGDVIGFGGESYDQEIAFRLGGFGKDVGRGLEAKRHGLFASFYFLRLGFGGTVVGYGGGEDGDRGGAQAVEDGAAHFFGGANVDAFDACGSLEIYGAADDCYFCAATCGGFGYGVAHFTGGAVGQEAHGVEVFAGWTRGDQDCFVVQIFLGVESLADGGYDFSLAR